MKEKIEMIFKKYKHIYFFLPVLMSFLNMSAQNLSDSTDYKKFYHTNGKLASEGFFINGKPEGYWKTYYETEVLKSEGNRKNFQLDSIWKFYDENGKLISEISYQNDLKNGLKKTYTDKEILEENYENDIKSGLTRYYFPDGKIKKTVLFEKGRETGISKEYTQEGVIIVLTEYRNGIIIRRENINRTDRNGKKQGVWKTFYEDETLQTEAFYVNGKKNGYFKEYNPDGTLKSIKKYIDDEEQKDVPELTEYEIRTDYYPDGSLKVVGSYKDGLAEGIRREYTKDGKIATAYIFEKGFITGQGVVDEKGLKQGYWKEFYNDGKLKAEGNYKDNIKNGEWKFYTENEKLKQQGKFNKNGFQTGAWKWFYEDGKQQKSEIFTNGVLEGETEEFDEAGNLITKGTYVEGNEDGPWIFVTSGYRQEGVFNYGRKNGLWKSFYPDQTLKFEGTYIDDYPDGKHTYYWENGKVKEERFYVMGKPEGTWRKYDETGALTIYIDYKRGIEYRYDGVIIKPVIEE